MKELRRLRILTLMPALLLVLGGFLAALYQHNAYFETRNQALQARLQRAAALLAMHLQNDLSADQGLIQDHARLVHGLEQLARNPDQSEVRFLTRAEAEIEFYLPDQAGRLVSRSIVQPFAGSGSELQGLALDANGQPEWNPRPTGKHATSRAGLYNRQDQLQAVLEITTPIDRALPAMDFRLSYLNYILLAIGPALLGLLGLLYISIWLGRTQRDLLKAHRRLKQSEGKYRHIVENAREVIFTADQNLKVLTVNRAVMEQIGMLPKMLIGRSLLDIIFLQQSGTEDETDRDIILEKIAVMKRTREPIKLRTNFIIESTGDSRSFHLELGYPRSRRGGQADDIIYGRAHPAPLNSLIKHVEQEHQSFAIPNSLVLAEDLSIRVTSNLRRFLDRDTAEALRIATREVIINAIEHGNLGISFDEKQAALAENRYLKLFRERHNEPRYAGRLVRVVYTLNQEYFGLTVEDEGDGFDHQDFLTNKLPALKASLSGHGRGLMLAHAEFHEMTFNETGNQVQLLYRINEPRPEVPA